MKRKNATRSALLTSVISLLLCVSMLVGATFAWFTDEVESGMNQITAGNLDVDVVTADGTSIQGIETLFNNVERWEPGALAYENLTVQNLGNLALKYVLKINFENASPAKNGKTLADALNVAIIPGGVDASLSREALISSLEGKWQNLVSFSQPGKLDSDKDLLADAETADTYGLVIYWKPTDADNDFNMNNADQGTVLTIDLGIHLFATQLEAEEDSYGSDYDKLAPWTGLVGTVPAEVNGVITIANGEELAAVAAAVNSGNSFQGKTIQLGADIDLNGVAWTPIGNSSNRFDGTFIGTGYTISNLYVTGIKGVGLFGYTWNSAHIEGVTIDNAYISGNDYVGAILGTGYLSANCIKDCTVMNAQIIATPYLKADGVTYDGGAKAGAIVGSAYNGNLTGNTAVNCEITAYRDLGGIAGMLYADGVTSRTLTASGNTVENVTLTYLDLNGAAYDGNKVNENMGNTVGRVGRSSSNCAMPVAENNTETNVTRKTVISYTLDGITYHKDVDTGAVTLYTVNADHLGTEVSVPEGVSEIGRYAFAYNDTIETIILPSTVTTLDERAFRDTSASTVVLNEGLTNISYQAFRNASNVKTVIIPSTVTTISKEAFQNSGITELVIPANVTTIEYGGLRDMKALEKVVINGNVDIPVYAFRACTNLKTVIIAGENVTFGGGSRGMIFTNKENGDGSAITVYVANETVKDRLLAADTAAKDYGGYAIMVSGISNNADSLVESLENGKDVILTQDVKIDPAGMSNAYGTTGINVKNGQTIDGNGNTLDIKGAGGTWDSGISTTGGLIKNITVTGSFRGVFINHNSTHSERVILENVIIDGTVYTISCDQGTGKGLTATNSTFNGWTSYAATLGDAKFVDCSFGEGQGYAYCRPYAPTEFVGCDFEAGFAVDPCAVITFENCTINGEPLTAENLSDLVQPYYGNASNASVK